MIRSRQSPSMRAAAASLLVVVGVTVGAGATTAAAHSAAPAAAPAGTWYTVEPSTIYDTEATGRDLAGGEVLDVVATGIAGVPSKGVTEIRLAVSSRQASPGQRVAIWSAGASTPAGTNAAVGTIEEPAIVTVPADGSGQLEVRSDVATNLVIDVLGYRSSSNTLVPSAGLTCRERADAMNLQAWTCQANKLLYSVNQDSATPPSVEIDLSSAEKASNRAEYRRKAVQRSGTGLPEDVNCEQVPSCNNQKTAYVAYRKDNIYVGSDGQTISEGDVVIHTDLQGATPFFRAYFGWDSGSSMRFTGWFYRIRKSDRLSDSYIGPASPVSDFTASSFARYDYTPSQTGTKSSGAYLSGASNKYHDDFGESARISAGGFVFAAAVLHTGRWKGCTTCKYYQVPWTTSP